MAKATTTITFADGDQVTSAKLNQIMSGFSLGADSVDGTTVTLSSGVLSVGIITATNLGSDAVTTVKVLDGSITLSKLAAGSVDASKIVALTITGSLIAETTIGYSKTLTADRAVQADMQAETALHFVSPDVLKYHPGVAKAYGTVAWSNGSASITGGYNITSAAEGTGGQRIVTMAITMANTNYVVTAIENQSGTPVICTAKTTTTFTLEGGTENASRAVSFIVHGQLA